MSRVEDAYRQRHSRAYDHSHGFPPVGDRFPCPCACNRILSREWFVAIYECQPEDPNPPASKYRAAVRRESRLRFTLGGLGVPDDFKDPSDDPTWLEDHRSIR